MYKSILEIHSSHKTKIQTERRNNTTWYLKILNQRYNNSVQIPVHKVYMIQVLYLTEINIFRGKLHRMVCKIFLGCAG